jgi:hypothetical protein
MLLQTAEGEFEVEARTALRLEPVDGKTRLSGRIAPHPEVAALVRRGVKQAVLDGVPVRLTEVDPWGGILVRAQPGSTAR